MYRQLLSIVGSQCAPKLIGLVIVMFVGSLLELVGFSLIIAIIAAMSDPGGLVGNDYVGVICDWLGLERSMAGIPWLIIGVIGIYLVRAGFLIVQYYVVVRFVRIERHRLNSALFAATLRRPYRYFLDKTSAEIQRDVIGDTGQFAAYLNALLLIAAEVLVVTVMAIFLVLVAPLISLICIAVVIVLIGGSRVLIHRKVFAAGKRVRSAGARRIRWFNEAIRGIKLVKIAQREAFFAEQYRESDETYATAEYKQQLWSRVPAIVVETVIIIAALIYLLVTFTMGLSLAETLPQLSAFVLVAARLVPAFNRINSNLTSVSYNRPAVDKLEAHLEELRRDAGASRLREREGAEGAPHLLESSGAKGAPDLLEDSGAEGAPDGLRDSGAAGSEAPGGPSAAPERPDEAPLIFHHELALKNVTFAYESAAQPVLRDASLPIAKGSCVGIVGPSGIGKTTLVDVLLGLLEPTAGSVCIDDVDIRGVYRAYLAAVAYLPQDAFIIEGTVAENVAFGEADDAIDKQRVWQALETAALKAFVQAQPDGLDTRVGEGGIRLSGGERQRLALARAIYSQCELLVLDEATSALDAATAESILDALAGLKGSHTIVIVAHQTNALAPCDVIYRVSDGRVIREAAAPTTDDHGA